jgi:hypothetical protein
MNELFIEIETLQNLLISQATGGKENNTEFIRLRKIILDASILDNVIPNFLKTCRSIDQFWNFIKHKYSTYAERRDFIYKEFHPMLYLLESNHISPSDNSVTGAIEKVSVTYVHDTWQKALERRFSDPEGAITSARTLIESVCKYILDEAKEEYNDAVDLPKLYKQTAELLNLAPSQHTEQIFKQILGGCTAIIEGLGSLRNKLSDAHGKGKIGTRPSAHHAELAVNLSGALSSYLIATWENKCKKTQ